MTALPQVSPAGNLFSNGGTAFGSFDYPNKESRSSYDIEGKKKRRAPQPPSGLGQYKPKILTSETSGNVPVPRSDDTPVPPPRPSRRRNLNIISGSGDVASPRPFLVGDKDVPMVIPPEDDPPDHDPQSVDLNVSSLNLTSHDVLGGEQEGGTDNPLFSMQDENTTVPQPAEDLPDRDTTVQQSADDSFLNPQDEGVSNPLHMLDSVLHATEEEKDDTEPENVYIPAPDYDEEEVTLAIAEEPEPEKDYPNNMRRLTKVFKEYDGEDFGQYLSDDENALEQGLRRASRPILENKSKTEGRRSQFKKKEPLPVRNKKDKGLTGFSSLRTFSYADSKFGTLKKKNSSLLSPSRDPKEAEVFVDTGASYEQFLYSKNGGDGGHMERDHYFMQDQSSLYSEPARAKESVWKKFTWKTKKQTNSVDMTAFS